MEDAMALIITLIILVIIPIIINIFTSDDNNQPTQTSTQSTTAPKVEEVHSPEYNAMVLLLNTDSGILAKEISRYLKTTIKKGCDDIMSKSNNQMLCGVQIKDYITTARNIYREHTTLSSLSGLSNEAWCKLVDSICIMLHETYFGNITDTPTNNN